MADDFILTGVDVLLDYVRKKGRVTVKEAAASIKHPQAVVEDWANILEEEGLLAIEYKLTKTFLVSTEGKNKKEDRKQIRKTVLKEALNRQDQKGPIISVSKETASSHNLNVEQITKEQRDKIIAEASRQTAKDNVSKDKGKKKFFFLNLGKSRHKEEDSIEGEPEEEKKSEKSKKTEEKIHEKEKNLKDETDDKIKSDEKIVAEAASEKKSFFQRLGKKEKQIEAAKTDIEDELAQLKKEEEELKKEIEKIHEHDKEIHSLPAVIKKQQKQIDELTKNHSHLNSHEKKLVDELKLLNKKMAMLQKGKIHVVRKPFLSILAPHTKHTGINKKYKNQLTDLQSQLVHVKNLQKELQDQLTVFKNENTVLKQSEANLKKKFAEMSKIMEKRQKKRPFLSAIAPHVSGARLSKQYKNEVKALKGRLTSLNSSQDDLQEQIKKLRNENIGLKKNEALLKDKLDHMKRPKSFYSEIKQDIKERKKQKEILEKQRLRENAKIQKKKELEKKQEELDKRKEKLRERNLEIENNNDGLLLEAEFDSLKNEETSEESKLESLKEKKVTIPAKDIKSKNAVENKNEKNKKNKPKKSKIFHSITQNLFGKDEPKTKDVQIKQNEKATLLKTKNYDELIEQANKELVKEKPQKLSEAIKIPVYKHESFAENVVRILEQEEAKLEKKNKVSKNKLKTIHRKKQRIREKLKKLEIEKSRISEEDFLNKREALYYALDKINNVIRGAK